MKTKLLRTRWQRLPEAAVRSLQAEKLRRYLNEVVLPFSPYYRTLLGRLGIRADSIRTLEDLERLPFTSKADLLSTETQPKKFREFILTPDPKVLSRRPATIARAILRGKAEVKRGFEREFRPVFMTSTTGRSADPIAFVYSKHDLDNLASAGDRVMQVCGAEPEFRLLNMFPYAPHLAFWFVHYGAAEFGVFSLGTGGGKVMGTEGNLRLIERLSPDVLIAMPTFLYHLLQQALERGMKIKGLRRLVLGGEKVAGGMRRKLRELAAELGSPQLDILATYGFTEAKMAWAECPSPADEPTSGYHMYPDLGLFEVIDPKSGVVLPAGSPGELVFTPLDARGSVVLRYRTGDYIDGGMTYEACPYCGRTVPRLVGNISRSSEFKTMQLDKVKGTLVDFNQLEHVLDDAPNVGAWQLELRKHNDDPLEVDELILHVHKSTDVDEARLKRALVTRLIEATEIQPNRIEFHSAERMRELQGVGVALKEEKVVDHRPSGPGPRGPEKTAGGGRLNTSEMGVKS